MKRPASTAGAQSGFTLIELLLVIAIIAIVAGVVIAAVSPRRNITGARDAERRHMEKQLSQALYARLIDEWKLPEETPEGQANAKPICRQTVPDAACGGAGGVSLSSLPPTYISAIPVDPVMPENSNCTGYMVYQEVGRPRVYAANVGKLQGDTPDGMCGVGAGGGETALIASRKTDGSPSNEVSGNDRPSLSDDGRYVAYDSSATDLAVANPNYGSHIYVFDRQALFLVRVSNDSSGTAGDNNSRHPAISGNGRFVAFDSYSSNLVVGDTGGFSDVFVHDTQTGQTTRVSVATGGAEGNNTSGSPSISDDGRYVAFRASATNLVAGDTNGMGDVFVHDRNTGQTTRVSVASDGSQAAGGGSRFPSISDDGRYVAFSSLATNLVAGDTNGVEDVFVHDTQTGQTSRVSVATGGAEGDAQSFGPFSISGDGRHIAFTSAATNLIAEDTNGVTDIFVHDTQTGQTTRVSVVSDGSQAAGGLSEEPGISDDGRYVIFESLATNLVVGDTNGYRDIFVHDRTTGTTVRVGSVPEGMTLDPEFTEFEGSAISGNSSTVAFGFSSAEETRNVISRINWSP